MKVLPQASQACFLPASPLWLRSCLLSLEAVGKAQWQRGCVQAKGLLPVCERRWARSSLGLRKERPQPS